MCAGRPGLLESTRACEHTAPRCACVCLCPLPRPLCSQPGVCLPDRPYSPPPPALSALFLSGALEAPKAVPRHPHFLSPPQLERQHHDNGALALPTLSPHFGEQRLPREAAWEGEPDQ